MNIRARLPKGYYYEILKILKKCRNDSKEMNSYYMYNKKLYWHGMKASEYMKTDTVGEFYKINVNIRGGEIFVPVLEGDALKTFWVEFPDLLMPYVSQSRQYFHFLYNEGPYELNKNVCLQKGDVVIDCGANIGLFPQ